MKQKLFVIKYCAKKAQVTIMLATSRNVLFPGYNHLLITSTNDPTLIIIAGAIIKVLVHQYWWLAGGYVLEIGHGGCLVDNGFFCVYSEVR